MTSEIERVISLLLMRFNLVPSQSIPLAEKWLKSHPGNSWASLEQLLKSGRVIFKNGSLHEIKLEEIQALVKQMRGQTGVAIEDRWYHLKLYPKCFIGSEAVEWLMHTQKLTKEEAIRLGQMLVEHQIIHHVVDEHRFKDGYFFYRFYEDETAASKSNAAKGVSLDKIQPEF